MSPLFPLGSFVPFSFKLNYLNNNHLINESLKRIRIKMKIKLK
jgi:hypothetical protein